MPSVLSFTESETYAQSVKSAGVPAALKAALMKKHPAAKGVAWEKNSFEANRGDKSKEDNSVVFTPAGEWVESAVHRSAKCLQNWLLDLQSKGRA